MQIAICDDEKEIRNMFAEKIRRLYSKADLLLYRSGEELLLSDKEPDILLLDIQMPGKNGMETAKELRIKSKKVIIIFVTALDDFVFQAFDVGAFHYLVKPFDDEKFAEVLLNAVKQFEDRKKLEDAGGKREKPSFMVTTGGKHITVNLEDIVYAEVFDRKVILHTMDSDIEYYGKMKELEKRAGDDFFRPHRAYLVNFNFISKYDATTIYLKRGQALMAKQNYHDFVKSYLRFNQKKTINAAEGGRRKW
ncbi:MAG: response regulator transcription factor [Lachnospiraceae bacterium]|nr:response regulator transcription factor [Lachnospiraceae bacterium]